MDKIEKTTKKNNQMIMTIIIVTGVVAVALIVAATFLIKYTIDKKYDYEAQKATETETNEEGEETTPDYKLVDLDTIDPFWKVSVGVTSLELPVKYSEFEALGYQIDTEDSSAYMIASGYSHMESIYAANDTNKENVMGTLEIYNPNDTDTAEKDCYIVHIDVMSDTDLADSLIIGTGASFKSTEEDFVRIFGEASLDQDTEDGDCTMYWMGDSDCFNMLLAQFCEGKLSSISIDYSKPFENYVYQLDDESGDEEIEVDGEDIVVDGDEIVVDGDEEEETE